MESIKSFWRRPSPGAGAYHTEFYPTYDYKPVWEAGHKSGK